MGQEFNAEEVTPRRESSARMESSRKRRRPQKHIPHENGAGLAMNSVSPMERSDFQDLDFTAASTLDMMTQWVQANPKAAGSQAWERYELYKSSRTIREAKANGCTLIDLRYDHSKGNVEIRPVVAGSGGIHARKEHPAVRSKMLRTKGKQHTGKKQNGKFRQAAEPPKGSACVPSVASRPRKQEQGSRRQGVHKGGKRPRGSSPPQSRGRVRQASSREEEPQPELEAECAASNLPAIRHVSLPVGPDVQADCVRCVHPGQSVPPEVEQIVSEIPSSAWSRSSTAQYRKCRSLHFGLGLPRFGPVKLGRGTEQFPDLQRLILNHARKIHPDIRFSSFILNQYAAGEMMGKHNDRNMRSHSMQLVLIWGNFEGGDLLVYGKHGVAVPVVKGPVTLLMDGNADHEVLPVTEGIRYSIVTYAKQTFPVCPTELKNSLQHFGFPLPGISEAGMLSQASGPEGIPDTQLRSQDHACVSATLLRWFDKMCEHENQIVHTSVQDCDFLYRLQGQRNSGDFCDLIILVNNDITDKHRCHQCVLAAHSDYLGTWLLQGLKGSYVQEVSMENVCSLSISIILDHIYGLDISEALHGGSLTSLWDVCKVALAWKVTGLFRICREVIAPRLRELEVCELHRVLRYLEATPSRRLSAKQTQC